MWKILLLVVLIAFLAYGGLCVYSNFRGADVDPPGMPGKTEATHSVYINNTGGLLLTNDYEQHGQEPGSRLFILHGYWEMRGNKYKFVDGDIVLDEHIFGEITIKRRSAK